MMSQDQSMANAFVPGQAILSAGDEALLQRRTDTLGPAYRLFYEEPFHPVRGEGVWLYDEDGTAYLDAYNNVACVGHCHPRVVEAMARQASMLTTHTRYLQNNIVDFAEDFLASFPDPLSHIMFTCTGSEANDLALRIARVKTGGTGVIVTENAYHGVTIALAAMSPSLGAGAPKDDNVFTIPAPSGQHGEQEGEVMRANVEKALAAMAERGIKPAALYVDTIFSSDGIFSHPKGFLKPAVDAFRAAGGLFVADEVQPGFARTGEEMWGFLRHGLVPDMVSMGKPMGNGYPVAALVVQPDVVAEFGERTRYFNTFGGNTTAIATAQAVWDIIHDESLQKKTLETGNAFRSELEILAKEGDVICDIRGSGLFIGVQIAGDDPRGRTARLVNALKKKRILISASGPGGDVLKIRPPLAFGSDALDFFMSGLREVIKDI